MTEKKLKSITQEEAEAKTRNKADEIIAKAKAEQKSNPSTEEKKTSC